MSPLEAVELADGDLDVVVLPARGLDLGTARFRGERFSWESPLGHIPWQGDFARSFGGGLLVTCGLRNVGLRSEGQPQHGWHSSLPARDVIVEPRSVRGRVLDAEVPGPALQLEREVRVGGGSLTVTDVVRSLGPPGPERVYEHLGATRAVVAGGGLRVRVASNLPRLWQWIHPDYGVLAIEPANCSVLGRAHDRAEGRLPQLDPGEARTTTLEITVELA